MYCIDLGERFPANSNEYLGAKSISIQQRMTPVEFARSSCTDHYYYRFSRSQFTKASKSEVSVDASTEAWEEEEAIDDEDEVVVGKRRKRNRKTKVARWTE